MKKVLCTVLAVLMLFSVTACGSDDESNGSYGGNSFLNNYGADEDNSYGNDTIVDDYVTDVSQHEAALNVKIVYGTEFCDGVSWLRTKEDTGKYMTNLVDTNGKVLLQFANSRADKFGVFNGGIAWCNMSGKIHIINNRGETVLESGTDFDELLAYGGGMALVYKYDGGIDHETHYYGIIDKNGEWVLEYQDWGSEPTRCYYAGDGVFVCYRNRIEYLYSTSTNTFCWLPEYGNSIVFEEGICALMSHDFQYSTDSELGENIDNDIESNKIDCKGGIGYKLTTNLDQRPVAYFECSIAKNGCLIYEKDNYLNIYHLNNDKNAVFDDYEIERIENDGVTPEYLGDGEFLYTIIGEDRNEYFVIIDEEGNRKFDPIKGEIESCGDGLIAYYADRNLYIIDNKGKQLYSENKVDKNVYFSETDDIIVIEDRLINAISEATFIDKSGNKIDFKLYK